MNDKCKVYLHKGIQTSNFKHLSHNKNTFIPFLTPLHQAHTTQQTPISDAHPACCGRYQRECLHHQILLGTEEAHVITYSLKEMRVKLPVN